MPFNALGHEVLAAVQGTEKPNWTALLDAVLNTPTGASDATNYEDRIEALLTALFYPDLTNPNVQHKIHAGRKRIDITYTNMAADGLFRSISLHHPAMRIAVECKNYNKDIANPELDQMIGRFSPSRGRVGLLISRKFENKQLFLDRCRDTAKDNNGFIIALDDDDLRELVKIEQTRRNISVGLC